MKVRRRARMVSICFCGIHDYRSTAYVWVLKTGQIQCLSDYTWHTDVPCL